MAPPRPAEPVGLVEASRHNRGGVLHLLHPERGEESQVAGAPVLVVDAHRARWLHR